MRADCRRFAILPAALLMLIVAVFASLSRLADAADPMLVFPIRQGDLHGLIDRTGRAIVPPEFEQPVKLQDGVSIPRESRAPVPPRQHRRHQ